MKYNAPYGSPDPNADYVNGNPSIGLLGSIIPAEAIDYPQREIVQAITSAALTPSNSDLTQLLQSIEILGRIPYVIDVGVANAIQINPQPPLTSYTATGQHRIFAINIAATNTGAAGISVSGLFQVPLTRPNGDALSPGDLQTGGIAIIAEDPTNASYQLVSMPANLAEQYVPIVPATNFYVTATGNDSTGNGTAAAPWRQIQHAVDILRKFATSSGVQINIGDGTYTSVTVPASAIGSWNFVGNITTPANCLIACNSSSVAPGRGFVIQGAVTASINGFGITPYYEAIEVGNGANVTIQNCNFTNPVSGSGASIANYGGYVSLGGTMTWGAGSYPAFIASQNGGTTTVGYHDVYQTTNVALHYGTTTVTLGTMTAASGGTINITPAELTQTGTVTGPRFHVTPPGTINSGGGGSSLLLGSTAGVIDTPTWYS